MADALVIKLGAAAVGLGDEGVLDELAQQFVCSFFSCNTCAEVSYVVRPSKPMHPCDQEMARHREGAELSITAQQISKVFAPTRRHCAASID